MAFGNQMQAKWQGLDMSDVYAEWAHSMGKLSVGAIWYGVNISKLEEHPPSLGKFMDNCKGYVPRQTYNPTQLQEKKRVWTQEEKDANLEKIRKMFNKPDFLKGIT